MELEVSHEDGYVLARTSGAIDETAAEPFREHLHPLVAEDGTRLVVDLSGSARINSRGLAQLVLLVTSANTHSSRVVFAAPSPFVSGVFHVTRLDTFFQVVPILSEAVERAVQS